LDVEIYDVVIVLASVPAVIAGALELKMIEVEERGLTLSSLKGGVSTTRF
jgi:hypothetical protein